MTFRAAFYKGTQPGIPGIYNRAVRAKERGPYSHCELVFSGDWDGWVASASFMDKGVRFKQIALSPEKWDFIELPAHLEPGARQWFLEHDGWPYDVRGNIYQAIGFMPPARRAAFCSGALASALQFKDGWRFGPNALACVLPAMNFQMAQ